MAQEYNIEQLLFDSFHNGSLHHEQEKESINIQGRIGLFGTQTRILYTSLTRGFLPLGPENLLIVLTNFFYLSQIPYGLRGKKVLNNYFKNNNIKSDYRNYKYDKVVNFYKSIGIKISDNALQCYAYFLDYLDGFNGEFIVDKNNKFVFIHLLAIVLFVEEEMKSLSCSRKTKNFREDEFDTIMKKIEDYFEKSTENIVTIKINDFLPVPYDEETPFNDQERNHYKHVTGFDI